MNSFYLGTITLIIISVLFYIFWVYYSWKNDNKILSVILPFVLFIFIWGPLLILKEEMTFPRTYLTIEFYLDCYFYLYLMLINTYLLLLTFSFHLVISF